MVADALTTARRLLGPNRPDLVRTDSTLYGADMVHAARTGGAHVSITVRLDPAVKQAIAAIPADAWTTITDPHPILDQATGTWTSRAEVAESTYTAFSSKKKAHRVTGRLVEPGVEDKAGVPLSHERGWEDSGHLDTRRVSSLPPGPC